MEEMGISQSHLYKNQIYGKSIVPIIKKNQQSLHDELTQLLKTYKAFPKRFNWPIKTGKKSI